ncbi:MAG: DNA translocase FtsK [Clostridia bacterium]|nr:DNA translocase FtsK [Clostridia bacterium]
MAYFDLRNKEFNKEKSSKSKTTGIVLVVACSIVFLILLTNFLPFLQNILLGILGLFAYPFSIIAFAVGIALINNKKYVMPLKYVLYLSITIICVLALLNIVILGNPNCTFGEYLGLTYDYKYTGGGILIGLLVAPLIKTLGLAGSVIIFSTIMIIFIALIADFLHSIKTYGFKIATQPQKEKDIKFVEIVDNKEKKPVAKEPKIKTEKEQFNLFLDKKMEEQHNNDAKVKLGLIEGNLDSKKSTEKPKSIKEHLLTPPQIDLSYFHNSNSNQEKREREINSNIASLKQENPNNHFKTKESLAVNTEIFAEPKIENQEILPETNNFEEKYTEKPKKTFAQLQIEGTEVYTPPMSKNIYRKPPNYNCPPLELLENTPVDLTSLNEDIVGKRVQLENVLETFGINAKVIGVVVGPSVTRYELEMPPGISVKKITAHEDDISLALASKAGIRIEAPIPGKSAVGIEVPNDNIAIVNIRDIIDSQEFLANKNPITFALGKDIGGSNIICNLSKMPHLLIAGATNSGKSICLNSIIISMIYKSSPDDLRLILIDPKRVEFSMYNDLPHLMLPKIITEVEMASNALTWAINEMERRYLLFQTTRCRNLEEYNNQPEVLAGDTKKMPYIVIIVDELADLMMMSKKDIEEKIKRLAQKARASGIHLVLATQRPSVDVITGTIKTNFPSRITFALTSFADSKTILDQSGAENLLGKGDMLYLPSDANFPKRIQGCFVSGDEVQNVVEFIKQNNNKNYDEEIENEITNPNTNKLVEGNIGDQNFDPLFPQALKMFIENGQASISIIQRRFLVGYPRAARIIDQLENAGYISKQEGSKPRNVYLTMEEFFNKFGAIE